MPTNAELNSTVEKLIKLVDSLATKVESLETELANFKTPVASHPTQSTPTWASHLFNSREQPSIEIQNVVSAVKINVKEETRKADNIMVFGLESSKGATDEERYKDDLARVEKILATCDSSVVHHKRLLGHPLIVSLQRLKSSKTNKPNSGVKPPPIVVKLDKIDLFEDDGEPTTASLQLLKKAKRLKDTEWKGVFLAPDLTRLDREFGKRLRAERDKLNNELGANAIYRYGIRGRQVVKIIMLEKLIK
jgi:hypothetical protein